MRRLNATEYQEMVAIFDWAKVAEKQNPELRMLHHCPNGGSRNIIEAARLKRSGIKRGAPDIYLDVPRGGCHGLRIELKSTKGKVSPEQREWLAALDAMGYEAIVCWGADEAIEQIKDYLDGKENHERNP